MQLELLAATDDASVALVSVFAVFYLALVGFGLFLYAKIVSRSGYPWPWIFIMFVPLVNLVMLCIFALRTWPVERELELTRQALEAATGSPFPPGSQLMTYGNYQIGSGLAGYGPGPSQGSGFDQSYGSPQGYGAPSYGAPSTDQTFGSAGPGYPEQPYGDPGQQSNPYSGFSPQRTETPEGPKY